MSIINGMVLHERAREITLLFVTEINFKWKPIKIFLKHIFHHTQFCKNIDFCRKIYRVPEFQTKS